MAHAQFIVEHIGPRNRSGRWRFMRGKVEIRRSREGDTKKDFVKYARAYVRCGRGPRQLLIRDLKGRFCEEASYDCDSPARG